MNSTFWGQWSDEYLKDHPELTPLTDELLAAFEARTGLKLPTPLVDLLRTKNGGCVENSDFMVEGKDYCVSEIEGVGPVEDFSSIRSCAFILRNENCAETRELLEKKVGDLSKVLLIADSGGFPYAFALNYNHLNSSGEPTVYCVWLEADESDAIRIADSFRAFLQGQYVGDPEPIVKLEEAKKYTSVAKGGYSGRHEASGNRVEIGWKICLDGDCILVFQEEDWGFGKKVTRLQINQSQLRESSGVLDFLFGLYQRFLLWRTGKEIGADLSQLANTKRLCISKEDAPLKPTCFNLTFHTHALGDELSADSWIRVRTAEPFEGRWKNRESKVWNDSIYSASKEELEEARRALAKNLL